MMGHKILFSVFTGVATLSIAPVAITAQTVQFTGRVLEKAAMTPVPGATVRFKGSNLLTTTDSLGRFTLAGNPSTSLSPRQLEWSGALLKHGMLRVTTLARGVTVETGLFDSQGRRLDRSVHRLAGIGSYTLPVLRKAPRNAVVFLKVRAADETYRFRVFQGSEGAVAAHAAFIPGEGALARAAAAGDSVEIYITGLVNKTSPASSNGDLGDIVMDYPPRDSIGVGARRPYGAIVLFDGTHGPAAAQAELAAKWVDWRDWPNGYSGNNWQTSTKNTSAATFKIAKDPEFPNDTNRVTLRSDSVTGIASYAWRWGYDDIEARPEFYKHGDVQIHVEWIAMGVYNAADPENPNTVATYGSTNTAAYYVNSGVYVQNRYEIQIQSNALGTAITDCHAMGSVVNEFAPSSTAGGGTGTTCSSGSYASPCPGCASSATVLKGNGQWQSYDITFRTSRWNGNTKTADGYLSMWWNGVLVHYNRRVQGLATGLANTSGEAMDSALYGIKLQRERGDVRFRNVWMKHLKIDSTNTAFGY